MIVLNFAIERKLCDVLELNNGYVAKKNGGTCWCDLDVKNKKVKRQACQNSGDAFID